MDERKRMEKERYNAALMKRLEREIEDGKLGENPSPEDKAAWLSRAKRAAKKNRYNKSAYISIGFRLHKKGGAANHGLDAEMLRKAAAASGLSMNEFIVKRLSEALDARGELYAYSEKRDEDETMLFLPEESADPILIEGEDALAFRELAECCNLPLGEFLRQAAREKAERMEGTSGFWRDRE